LRYRRRGNDIEVVAYGELDNETDPAAYKANDPSQVPIERVQSLPELRFASATTHQQTRASP